MAICVSAPALSHLRPALRLDGPARPVIGLQERRTAGAAAWVRGAARHSSAATARLGRPRSPRGADPAPADPAADTPAGHPRHCPALAPPPRHPEADLSAPDGATPVSAEVATLIERLATENHGWDTSGSKASCSSSATGSARPRSAGSSKPGRSRRHQNGALTRVAAVPARPGIGDARD